jgi:hypothetical protein
MYVLYMYLDIHTFIYAHTHTVCCIFIIHKDFMCSCILSYIIKLIVQWERCFTVVFSYLHVLVYHILLLYYS